MNKSKIISIVTNKYFLATFGFVLLILLSDRNSIFDQIKYKRDLKKVQKEHDYYKNEIARIDKEYNELFGSNKGLEKFAREKYHMKRDSEDVFIMVEEGKEEEN